MAAWPAGAQTPSDDTLLRWRGLNALAAKEYGAGHYAEGIKFAEEALSLARKAFGGRARQTLLSLDNLASLYFAQSRYGEAEPLNREALQGWRGLVGPRHPDTLTSLTNLANLCRAEGRYGESAALYREALETEREALGPRHPATLASLHSLAYVFYLQGHYDKAEPLYREVLQARREVLGPRHPQTLATLSNLASLFQAQGRYREAEPLFKEALEAHRETLGRRHPDTLTSLNNLAGLYDVLGRYGETEQLFREVLQARREVLGPRHPDTLRSMHNLAGLFDEQGRHGEAEPLYREVLQARREVLGPRHPDTLASLNALAANIDAQGRHGEAEPLFREALQGQRELLGRRHPDMLITLNNLANNYESQGRYDEAEPLFREALQAHRGSPAALHNLAYLYDLQGRYSEAEPLYREALQKNIEAAGLRHPLTLGSQLGLATLLAKTERRAEAVRTLQQMEPNLLGWIGQELYSTEAGAMRRQLVSSQATIQTIFQDTVLSLAATAGDTDARRLAATVMLRFKVLQGEEEAYLARLARRSKDPRVQALVNDIGALRATLAAAAQGAPDAFEKTLRTLEGKRRELIGISPEYQSRLQVQAASLEDVRKALPAGSVLIEFRQFRPVDFRTGKRGEPRFAGLLMTGSGEPAVADLGPVADLQLLAAALRGGPGGRGLAADPRGKPLTPADEAAAKLYGRLLAPFKDALARASAVYVAPDGILNLVSFARLKLPDGRYWFAQQEMHVLQTGRDLLRPEATHPARGLLALGGIDFSAAPVGTGAEDSVFFAVAGSDRSTAVTRAAETFRGSFPPLPATDAEVKDVMAQYRLMRKDEPAEVWSGADASKARLMALKTPPCVLHLATHGFYLPNQSREPMLLSGIALAGANREVAGVGKDGLLFAIEAERLNLDGTELVVLSACNTAQGRVDYSEGVFGLARALRIAGARDVLVTLWPLDDGDARDFMADFYRNWLRQVQNGAQSDPAGALRDTQLQWIKQADRADPSAWAPYVLIE